MFGDKFKGDDGTTIRLFADQISCGGETKPVKGVRASVEEGSALESRVTLTRAIAFGVFALAMKKKKGGEKYLTVEGPDFAWVAQVDRKHIPDAMKFATKVNDASLKYNEREQDDPVATAPREPSRGERVTKQTADDLAVLAQKYTDGVIGLDEFMEGKRRLGM